MKFVIELGLTWETKVRTGKKHLGEAALSLCSRRNGTKFLKRDRTAH